ncbi:MULTISPECIES: DMT family transporter [unclassified Endozoicomonas]|uniref:DMT family transporter n=1 Tax=unclassified Endozoicomonas TaxID=2644528 RepID=UPI00214859ED|nr:MULTISPECIES: DMT family transporter [unclassified Endozoicomonas]
MREVQNVSNATLFCICSLVWGSTWYAVSWQLGTVDAMWSVAYRFLSGAVLLWFICCFRGGLTGFTRRQHLRFFFQGTFLCGISYWLVYESEKFISSGLSALICTGILYSNVVIARFWLGHAVKRSVLIGATLGSAGVLMVFFPHISQIDSNTLQLKGLALALGAALMFSMGSVSCEVNQKDGLSVAPVTVFAMFYGGLEMGAMALLRGVPPTFDFSPGYLVSLIYLVTFGSVVAMTSYIALIQRMGSDRTAYVDIIYPIIALLISTVLEGHQWTPVSVLGVAVILLGNLLAMGNRFDRRRSGTSC